ncbi:F-box protein CPR1-like [Diospyros lotus]|uniref:F-box protein CPR1-like n=1 Tax=Diospyros lotus TaxID=55363 RepID=UPI002254C4FB|nr:F-box protein CPR1-like [Diospyros lotus]XP_052209386.1 F-box protein CPR1-like [Diospyros lotus]XP_052209387.1 F-box protein CPR1-like [Diospyros lotus]
MSALPAEILADILSRLPVKPLLRIRCVSKPWCALIDSSSFVKLHLNRSLETKTNLSFILRDDHLHSVDFDSMDGVAEAMSLDHHPLRCQDYGTEVWGSCDGLICMSNALDTVVLWNPNTRKSRKLPYSPVEFEDASKFHACRVYGFGYDSASDDYKVVRIVALRSNDLSAFRYEVKVYSLKANSWHRAGKFPHYPNLKRTCGVLANGSLHWVVTQGFDVRKDGSIVAFDLAREDYHVVPQPDYSDMNFFMLVHSLGGCLSIFCNYYLSRVDIWVMKEYDVKASWTRLISVAQPGVIGPFQYLRPVTYSKDGREVLLEQDSSRLIWYDLKLKRARDVRIQGTQDMMMQMELCVGSLIPLNGGGETDGKKQQEKEERNMKDFLTKGFKLVL